jgi:hypothetical protein
MKKGLNWEEIQGRKSNTPFKINLSGKGDSKFFLNFKEYEKDKNEFEINEIDEEQNNNFINF